MPADEHGQAGQPLPPASQELTPSPKASDAERDAALDRLRTAFVDGRLTDEELDQRARAALTARTTSELEQLLADLPLAAARPGATATREERPVRLTVGILGDRERRWRWRIARRSTAIAVLGACRLDLRAARLSAPVTTITAVTVVGGIDVVVPPGVRVELSLYGLLCDATNLMAEQDLPADAPVVRVRLVGLLGGVEAKPKFRREMRAIDPNR